MASNPNGNDTFTMPGGQFYYDQSAKFNPTTAVVIISLIGGTFALAFLSVLLRRCLRGGSRLGPAQTGAAAQLGSYNVAKTKGLGKSDVDALPLVHRADLDEKHDRDCPVCLTEFEAEDTLRLLPGCKHVFHRECIDAWFDAHSTCPLCRASLVHESSEEAKNSTAGEQQQAMPGHGDPVETITEVSENGDSDSEARQPEPLEADLRTVTVELPQSDPSSREDERSSNRGALLRNSESFKRASAAAAAADTASAPNPSTGKNSSFRKPPAGPSSSIRRSSSLSADLISLRNLLMGQADQSNVNATEPPSASSSWYKRARSLDLALRDRADLANSREPEWVTIDLETDKATTGHAAEDGRASSPRGESSQRPPERARSDRWSLASLKGAIALSRSTSDASRARHLPV